MDSEFELNFVGIVLHRARIHHVRTERVFLKYLDVTLSWLPNPD